MSGFWRHLNKKKVNCSPTRERNIDSVSVSVCVSVHVCVFAHPERENELVHGQGDHGRGNIDYNNHDCWKFQQRFGPNQLREWDQRKWDQ